MIRRPPRSTPSNSSAASDVYKRQHARAAPTRFWRRQRGGRPPALTLMACGPHTHVRRQPSANFDDSEDYCDSIASFLGTFRKNQTFTQDAPKPLAGRGERRCAGGLSRNFAVVCLGGRTEVPCRVKRAPPRRRRVSHGFPRRTKRIRLTGFPPVSQFPTFLY